MLNVFDFDRKVRGLHSNAYRLTGKTDWMWRWQTFGIKAVPFFLCVCLVPIYAVQVIKIISRLLNAPFLMAWRFCGPDESPAKWVYYVWPLTHTLCSHTFERGLGPQQSCNAIFQTGRCDFYLCVCWVCVLFLSERPWAALFVCVCVCVALSGVRMRFHFVCVANAQKFRNHNNRQRTPV